MAYKDEDTIFIPTLHETKSLEINKPNQECQQSSNMLMNYP